MKKKYISVALLLLPLVSFAQISITGAEYVEITPEATTGLKKIYVLQTVRGATVSYSATSDKVSWQRYSSLGGGYAEAVSNVSRDGNVYSIVPEGDMGYIINDGTTQLCFWITNYANYPYTVSALSAVDNDCDRLMLDITGTAPAIPYYSITGRRMIIDREIELSYSTLTYSQDAQQYVQTRATITLEYAENSVSVAAPLCSTTVTIQPGRFATLWHEGVEVESGWVTPTAVEATTFTVQDEHKYENEIGTGDSGSSSLGGSAPCEITFSAAVTDAAIYRRWEFSDNPGFEDSMLTFSDLEVSYTFEEAGNTYVRFVADNASGTCPYTSETYVVTIGESRLECPNAFSPGASEGVNDEWKVSYQSIIEFHCEIFNRWGQKLATLTEPSQGWDGKVGGKVVPAGVYFYVLNAVGSDGKKYKLSGDINVVSSRRNTNLTNPMD